MLRGLFTLSLKILEIIYKSLFVTYVLGGSGILASAIALWTKHYGGGVLFGIIGLILLVLTRTFPRIRPKLGAEISKRIEPAVQKLPEGTVAQTLRTALGTAYGIETMAATLSPDDTIVDRVHKYKKLVFKAGIDANGDYRGTYERHGQVQGAVSSEFLTARLVSSAVAPSSLMELKVTDLDTNQDLHKEIISETFRKLIFRIFFPRPLKYGESFSVGWTFVCPHAMRQERDSDTYVLWPFELGIDRLEISLLFDWQPQQALLYEMSGARVEAVGGQPQYKQENSKHRYSALIKHPHAAAYILKYV
jgi:hypothetical protein